MKGTLAMQGSRYGGPLAFYGVAAGVAVCASYVLGRDPLRCDAWLGTSGAASVLFSLGAGTLLGAGTIAATRAAVRHAAWARALHAALRPSFYRASDGTLFAVAAASATGEELLFRGVLVPLVGIVASSILFGGLHQVGGRARWWWIAWATTMGILFGTVFAATGSLVGPVLAHAAINHANLRYLRDNDPAPPRRKLGGLLRR